MDVKEAARASREYITDLFGDEGISDVLLEEVEFDDVTGGWRVTIGFNRRAAQKPGSLGLRLNLERQRSYKVVRMSRDGTVKSVTDRVLPAPSR